jgi:hypothetical protein
VPELRRTPLFERFDRGVHRFSPELEALDLRNLRPRVSSRYLVLHWFRADGTQIQLQRQASPKAAIAEYLRPRIHKLFGRERSWHQSK